MNERPDARGQLDEGTSMTDHEVRNAGLRFKRSLRTRSLISVAAVVVLAVVLGIWLALPQRSQANTFGVTGIIDCGLASGKRCTIGDTVTILTSDVTGADEKVVVDISWIKDYFEEEDFDQDDAICLEVDDAGGKLRRRASSWAAASMAPRAPVVRPVHAWRASSRSGMKKRRMTSRMCRPRSSSDSATFRASP
jgi:hypothetical protein